MIRVLFAAGDEAWDSYALPLKAAFAAEGLTADLSRDHAPTVVDYIVFAPDGPVRDFAAFVNTRAVLGLWAGVETVVGNATLTQPLARMVDDGLTQGMVEWVTGHVLRHHLGMDTHLAGQDGTWRVGVYPPLARDRPVTVLGLGALGSACAQALAGLGFPVAGWARRPRRVPGVARHAGADGLQRALQGAQVVVTLLPRTPATENVLNGETLGWLAPGAFVVNPGRGALIDDVALLAALDSGQVGAATLDVFRMEPLPPSHPYWTHPRVTVTPHVAAATRPDSAARVIAANIARDQRGAPLLHLVDRAAGY
ncbi:glyoxylate/hydroxypyruvate reductase A [Loktanella fryxellensis]|uniref:Glyoxylate/hydroxypyruvate reductase A n=1 Tax=Loktanella fryxellensis TaxID=245187 RepID=A0A1H8B1I4_9RHOB|nr:glyoxylate/hydroxypyruvate reductase A [Loktanella fryxellensis]SEM76765.1 glyoxylate/hydroxypyruvate reductase A [Loktanella fryxellensis]